MLQCYVCRVSYEDRESVHVDGSDHGVSLPFTLHVECETITGSTRFRAWRGRRGSAEDMGDGHSDLRLLQLKKLHIARAWAAHRLSPP